MCGVEFITTILYSLSSVIISSLLPVKLAMLTALTAIESSISIVSSLEPLWCQGETSKGRGVPRGVVWLEPGRDEPICSIPKGDDMRERRILSRIMSGWLVLLFRGLKDEPEKLKTSLARDRETDIKGFVLSLGEVLFVVAGLATWSPKSCEPTKLTIPTLLSCPENA